MSTINVNAIDKESGSTLTLGTSGTTVDIPSGATFDVTGATVTGFGLFASYAIIADQKSSGTNGGTATGSGSATDTWYARDLNTEIADPDGIVSIGSNRFTLATGNYLIRWTCPFYRTEYVKTRLYDYTNSVGVGVGCTGFTTNTADRAEAVNWIGGSARVTPSGSTAYEIQYECYNTHSSSGLGVGDYYGSTVEQYTVVEIYKEAS